MGSMYPKYDWDKSTYTLWGIEGKNTVQLSDNHSLTFGGEYRQNKVEGTRLSDGGDNVHQVSQSGNGIVSNKYYSDKEYTGELEDVLHQVLREMCEKQLVFPYYMNYKEEWLREVQLYNKVMAAYRCKPGGKVRLYYKMKQKDREELGYRAEAMMPVYENLYVKQFVLYNDESVNYYFQESGNGEMITTDKKTLKTDKERVFAGKYQMLNAMTDMDSDAERSKAMLEFEEEEQMADQIFKIY